MAQTISPLPPLEQFGSEQQLKSYFLETALKQYSSLFGQEAYPYYPYLYTKGGGALADFPVASDVGFQASNGSATSTTVSNPSYSQTNTQEQGVDEADLVETNGKFIYQVDNQKLTVIDARNPTHLAITFQKDLSDLGNIQGMYLYNNQLTVVSTQAFWPLAYRSTGAIASIFPPYNYEPTVKISVFDVSNPRSIKLQESSTLDGTLLSSRAVGDKVYVVTQDSFGLPAPETVYKPRLVLDRATAQTVAPADDLSISAKASTLLFPPSYPQGYRYETKAEYLKRIQGKELALALPEYTTVDGRGKTVSEGLLNQAQDIYKPLTAQPYNMASVSMFDVDDRHLGPDASIGVPTNNLSEVYMSQENLYLLGNWWQGDQTGILKIDLDSLDLVARGEVPGRALDQFSVDEENGFLRVATTEGFGTKATNNLYVLGQQGQTLKTVGQIDNIAPGETIRSARLQDDYGFLVTFQQVDPFFALDLSKPTAPKITGEIKLPGFSEYLQVIENEGRTQVLGVGRDADAMGRAKGLKLSLFDVENLYAPKEVDSYLFEGQYSSSEAQWDPQAVGYFASFDRLAIPFQNSVGGQGLRVFDVDAQDGFSVIGDISHGNHSIRRSLVIGDDLYAISAERITVHDIHTLKLMDEVVWSGAKSGGSSISLGGPGLLGAAIATPTATTPTATTPADALALF